MRFSVFRVAVRTYSASRKELGSRLRTSHLLYRTWKDLHQRRSNAGAQTGSIMAIRTMVIRWNKTRSNSSGSCKPTHMSCVMLENIPLPNASEHMMGTSQRPTIIAFDRWCSMHHRTRDALLLVRLKEWTINESHDSKHFECSQTCRKKTGKRCTNADIDASANIGEGNTC